MKSTPAMYCIVSMLSLIACNSHADETFTDESAWFSNLTGSDFLGSDYSSLDPLGIADEVVGPLFQSWGDVDFVDSGNGPSGELTFPVVARVDGLPAGVIFPGNICTVLTVDSMIGPLEGFGFEYEVLGPATVTVFDSSNNVVGMPFDLVVSTGPETDFFGWVNCSGADVARIEICGESLNAIVGGSFSFNPVVGEPTCQDQLQSIIDALNLIQPTASADDQYWIDWAIHDLTCAQDSFFWDTDDRLSDNGNGFFQNIFWATYSLECVSDEAIVIDSLNSIQDLLSCVVENEIEYAMENPEANDRLLNFAQCIENLADAYSEAGLYLHAVLLHFYAWLFANHAA